jgi:O-antigen/teichoic acid export membrane protein
MEPLRAKTAQNLWYQGVLTVTTACVSVASVFVLAHLLDPEEFGRAMFAFLIVTSAEVLSDFGVMTAFLSRREEVGASIGAAASLRLFLSLAAAGGLAALSFILQGPFASLGIAEFLLPFALVPLLSGLGFGAQLRLRLDLDFRRLSFAQAGGTIGSPVAQATLAVLGFGAWSIVLGALVGYALHFVFLQVARPTFLRPVVDLAAWRRLLKFGVHVLGASVLLDATNIACATIVRAFAGAEALGTYLFAVRVATLVPQRAAAVVSEVLLPTLSHIAQKGGELVAPQVEAVRAVALPVSAANFLGMALAIPAVAFIGNASWGVAVPAIQWLALWGVIGGLTAILNPFIYVRGRPDITVRQMAIVISLTFVLGVPLTWALGLPGFLYAQVAISAIGFGYILQQARKLGGPTGAQVGRAAGPALVSCALAAGAAYLAAQGSLTPLVSLVIGVAVFAGVALACDHALFRGSNRKLLLELAGAVLPRRPA